MHDDVGDLRKLANVATCSAGTVPGIGNELANNIRNLGVGIAGDKSVGKMEASGDCLRSLVLPVPAGPRNRKLRIGWLVGVVNWRAHRL